MASTPTRRLAGVVCIALSLCWLASAEAADPCDRACLEAHVEAVLAAMPYAMTSDVWDE